jgi:uncharacterized protein (DUF111 family)
MHHDHHHEENRTFAEIKKLIGRSKLSAWVKKKSVAVFQRIAEAEGKIHGRPPEKVHFHEVGAVDSIVDIVGACIALGTARQATRAGRAGRGRHRLGGLRARTLSRSRPGDAGDSRRARHRRDAMRRTARTGHAHRRRAAGGVRREFRPMQNLVAEKIGFGLGTRDNQTRPNVLRAVLGKCDAWTCDGL